jgi:hypothetical protein
MTPSEAARQARIKDQVTALFEWVKNRALDGAKPEGIVGEIRHEIQQQLRPEWSLITEGITFELAAGPTIISFPGVTTLRNSHDSSTGGW